MGNPDLPARLALLDVAFGLHSELCAKVDHITRGLWLIVDGDLSAAHEALWLGGMTASEPAEFGPGSSASTTLEEHSS